MGRDDRGRDRRARSRDRGDVGRRERSRDRKDRDYSRDRRTSRDDKHRKDPKKESRDRRRSRSRDRRDRSKEHNKKRHKRRSSSASSASSDGSGSGSGEGDNYYAQRKRKYEERRRKEKEERKAKKKDKEKKRDRSDDEEAEKRPKKEDAPPAKPKIVPMTFVRGGGTTAAQLSADAAKFAINKTHQTLDAEARSRAKALAEERKRIEEEYARNLEAHQGKAWRLGLEDGEESLSDVDEEEAEGNGTAAPASADAPVAAPEAKKDEGPDPLAAFLSDVNTSLRGEVIIGVTDGIKTAVTAEDIAKGNFGATVPPKPSDSVEAPVEDDAQDFMAALKAFAQSGGGDEKTQEQKLEEQLEQARKENEERIKGKQEALDATLGANDGFDYTEDTTRVVAKHFSHETKAKELKAVDHSKIQYEAFRKSFFIVPPDIAAMSEQELKDMRHALDGTKIKGINPPRPIKTWDQCGMNDECLRIMQQAEYGSPFAVQAQGIPILMSGRDLLAMAKTGSGKTLTYALPLIRHVADQRRVTSGVEGPIALVMVPTHELAAQIVRVMQPFCDAVGIRLCGSYGGVSLRENIAACRRGAEVMVATTGRLIDLLCANRGKVTNLRRCTYCVVDEADRMFDEGFGFHVEAILRNVRPDRQTALLSATMPREVKNAAGKWLTDPIEIAVGGRPSPSNNVKQYVEIFEDGDEGDEHRWQRLLQILGDRTDEKQLTLIFVDNKDECNSLLLQLATYHYRDATVLHSGMDQVDRELALRMFELKEKPILIATSVAERGIDVLDLGLVVNYTCPNHFEAYVNRIGRTGRAGRKGTAYTLFKKGRDEAMVEDLVRGLEASGNDVPEELQTLAQQMWEKYASGLVRRKSTYTKGFRNTRRYGFDGTDMDKVDDIRANAKALGLEAELEDSQDELTEDEEGDVIKRSKKGPKISQVFDERDQRPDIDLSGGGTGPSAAANAGQLMVVTAAEKRIEDAKKFALALTDRAAQEAMGVTQHYECQYEINDLAQVVRKKICQRDMLSEVAHDTETSITVKGSYSASSRARQGESLLHLDIRGTSEAAVRSAYDRLEQFVTEENRKASAKMSAFGGITIKM